MFWSDCVMPEETVIVGEASSRFICTSAHNSEEYHPHLYFFDAVALVFAKDKNKPPGTSFSLLLRSFLMNDDKYLESDSAMAFNCQNSDCQNSDVPLKWCLEAIFERRKSILGIKV